MKVQLEQRLLMSTMFSAGDIRAVWCPSKLNLSDMITWSNTDPVAVANSEIYRSGKLPKGDQIADLLDDLIPGNTFVRC